MATYRVVLQVEVEDEDIVRSRDENSLEDLKENSKGDGYLDFYVEDEMAWLHRSFSTAHVKSVQRLKDA